MNKKIYLAPIAKIIKVQTPCMQVASITKEESAPISSSNDIGAKEVTMDFWGQEYEDE